MNKTDELTAEEIERLRQYHYSTGPMNIPLGIDKLCDMALRTEAAETAAESVDGYLSAKDRVMDLEAENSNLHEQLAALRATKAVALPEDLAELVKEFRERSLDCFCRECSLLRKTADTIEALNAARVKAEGERDANAANVDKTADLLEASERITTSWRDRAEAAEASRDALVKALRLVVDTLDAEDWTANWRSLYETARAALRAARDAALSPDEAYPGQFEQLDALFSEPPPSEDELKRIEENRQEMEEHMRRHGYQAGQQEATTPARGMKLTDGGRAFPRTIVMQSGGPASGIAETHGMSLRDWFAGQALAGVAQVYAGDPPRLLGFLEHKDLVAEYAYAAADAMLRARAALGEPE